MNSITLAFLSWKRRDVFRQTLQSYQKGGLLDLIPNRWVFFQECSDEDRALAEEFGCQVLGCSTNIGIAAALQTLILTCQTDHLLFCENDWYLLESAAHDVANVLQDSITLLEQGDAHVVRLRHVAEPGPPLYSHPSDVDAWLKCDVRGFPYKLESLTWVPDPEALYSHGKLPHFWQTKQLHTGPWYITDLRGQKWSNNVFLASTKYLKEVVLPALSKHEALDNYTGLETVMNVPSACPHMQHMQNTMRLAAGKGLFTHRDRLQLT